MSCTKLLLNISYRRRAFMIYNRELPIVLDLTFQHQIKQSELFRDKNDCKQRIRDIEAGFCYKCGHVQNCGMQNDQICVGQDVFIAKQ